jgi:hypothetical protein
VLYYESEYESAEPSLEDFFGLITNIYAWQIDAVSDMLDYDTLLAAAYDEEISAVWVGPQEGQFRIFWLSCDGECVGVRPGRN